MALLINSSEARRVGPVKHLLKRSLFGRVDHQGTQFGTPIFTNALPSDKWIGGTNARMVRENETPDLGSEHRPRMHFHILITIPTSNRWRTRVPVYLMTLDDDNSRHTCAMVMVPYLQVSSRKIDPPLDRFFYWTPRVKENRSTAGSIFLLDAPC